MQNNEQENTEVFEGKEETAQKKKKLKIDKKHIQGFIAGILVSAIVFTGLLTGFNPGFLTGAMQNQDSIICDISLSHIKIDRKGYYYVITCVEYGSQSQDQKWIRVGNEITIKGSTSKYKIVVCEGVKADIVLDGVNMKSKDLSPLWINRYAEVKLTLKNENELSSGSWEAIYMDSYSSLEVFGSGSLTVIGGKGKPGISDDGTVQIHSDNVTIIDG